ncbi:MAG TPA: uroporphyrinogen decarboxylase [Bacteroidales bacterium]|nr:uroporphyrinogen decarboxylase [Bacteroidales bacterium]
MTNKQWSDLKTFINGGDLNYVPSGFIIDSPWLPGWNNISTIEYYACDRLWWETNVKAINTFPEAWFIPGFWSEYGMCTEPSAFGARMVWSETSLPHAGKVLESINDIDKLVNPCVETDGLLPYMIQRLKTFENRIIDSGHNIRFAVTRGPLNIASFLMGTTEFMMALMTDPEKTHRLMKQLTAFIKRWIKYQKDCFPSIEGVLVLDDIIGFIGENEFREFVIPYFLEIFSSLELPVKILHNDAKGLITALHLKEMSVNVFNFSFEHNIRDIHELAGPDIVLLGNIPPRDVMAAGNESEVRKSIREQHGISPEGAKVIWSVGGGMAPDTPTENIVAFLDEVKNMNN